MKTLFLTCIFFFGLCSFLNKVHFLSGKSGYQQSSAGSLTNIFDLSVHRLSGERVLISWHTENESEQNRFEVMRKHDKLLPFSSLGVVKPKLKEDNSADYTYVDDNRFSDSSFYCLKKTNSDGVVFFSITKGVEGIGKER